MRFSKDKSPCKTNLDFWFWEGEYRAAVVDAKAGAELEAIIKSLGHLTLGGASRKKAPRGFDAGHRRAPLLLHDGLHAFHEGPLPKSVHTAKFIDDCLSRFRAAAPISLWLVKRVAAASEKKIGL